MTDTVTAPLDADATIDDVIRLTTKHDVVNDERVPLFVIDDVTYTVPAKPRVNLALKFMWQAKTLGQDTAAMNILEDLLGTEGFQALMEYDDLTQQDLEAVIGRATKLLMGSLESVTGGN